MPTTSGFAVTMPMSTGLQLHHDNTPIEAGAPVSSPGAPQDYGGKQK
jgi:hypothetical protein